MEKEKYKIINHVSLFKIVDIFSNIISLLFTYLIIIAYILIIIIFLDNIWHIPQPWRIIFFLGGGVILIPFILKILHVLKISFKENYALKLEKDNCHNENVLVNALEYSHLNSLHLNDIQKEIINFAGDNLLKFNIFQKFKRKKFKKEIIILIVLIVLHLTYIICIPSYFQNGLIRSLFPFRNTKPLTRTRINKQLSDATIAAGNDHVINFRLIQGDVSNALVIMHSKNSSKINEEIIYKDRKGDFSFVFSKPRNSLIWYLKVGDYISQPHNIRVIKPPSIISFSTEIKYPDFLNYKNQHVSDIHSILTVAKNSTLHITLEVDQLYAQVSVFQDVNKLVKLDKISSYQWSVLFLVKNAFPLKILFKDNEGFFIEHPESLHINVINDQPPSIDIKEMNLDFLPFSKSVSLEASVLDELGIKSLTLQYKNNNQWHVYEAMTDINSSTIHKTWVVNLNKIKFQNLNQIEFKVFASDYNPSNAVTQSGVIKVKQLGMFEYKLNILKNLIDNIGRLKFNVSDLLLLRNSSEKLIIKTLIKSILEEISSDLVILKKYNVLDSRMYTLHKDIANTLKILSLSKSGNDENLSDRLASMLVLLVNDLISYKSKIFTAILNGELREIKDLVGKIRVTINTHYVDSILTPYQNFMHLINALNSFSSWLEVNKELKLFKQINTSITIISESKIKLVIHQLSKKINKNNNNIIKKLKTQAVKEIGALISNLLVHKIKVVNQDISKLKIKLQFIIRVLIKTNEFLGHINLKKGLDKDLVSKTISRFIKILDTQSQVIGQLQKQYSSKKIKGSTLLRAAIFDIKETGSLYDFGRVLKAKSKLGKSRNNIELAITNLESLCKQEDYLEEKMISKLDVEVFSSDIKIKMVQPRTNLVLLSDAILPIKGFASSKNGVSQIWLYLECNTINNVKTKDNVKMFLLQDYPDLPETVSMAYDFDLSNFSFKNGDVVTLYLQAFDGSINKTKTNLSKKIWFKVKNPLKGIDTLKYFRIKNGFASVFKKLIIIESKIYELFKKYQKQIFHGVFDIKLIRLIADMQSIAYEKFSDTLGQLHGFYRSSTFFPEEDFIKYYNYINDSLLKELSFLKVKLHSQCEIVNNDLVDNFISNQVLDINVIFEKILSGLQDINMFFGIPISEIALKSKDGRQIVSIIETIKNMQLKLNYFQKSNLVKEIIRSESIQYLVDFIKKSSVLGISKYLINFTGESNDLLKSMESLNAADCVSAITLKLHYWRKILESNLTSSLYQLLRKEYGNIRENKKYKGNIKKIQSIVQELKSVSSDSSATELITIDIYQKSTLKSKSLTNSLKGPVERVSSLMMENNLNRWQKLSLLENKFRILSVRLDNSLQIKVLTRGQFKYLRKLLSLFDIFVLQLDALKEDVNFLSNEEKSGFLEKINMLLATKNQINEIVKTLKKKLDVSMSVLMKKHDNVLKKELEILLQQKIEIHSYPELSKKYSDFVSSFSLMLSELLLVIEEDIETVTPVISKLITQLSNMLKITFYTHDDNFSTIQNSILNQIKYLIILKKEMNTNNGGYKYIESIVDVIKQEKTNLYNYISSFLNNISVKIRDEQKEAEMSNVTDQIKDIAIELKKNKDEISTLMSKINKTKKDLKHINILEKKIVKLHFQMDKLKEKLENIETGKKISISRLETIQKKLPVESKVLFNDIDSQILDVNDTISRKKELLDEELLRNFVEELEELQAFNDQPLLKDEKLKEIRKHLSLFGIKTDGSISLPDMIKEVKQKEASILENVAVTKISDIVNNLNQASNKIDDISLIDSSNNGSSDARKRKLRFLNGLQQSANSFERVQDSLGEAYITKSKFNSIVRKKLDDVNLNLQELEQSFIYGKNVDNLLAQTYEDLKEIRFIYSKETRIMFVNNNILSDTILNQENNLTSTSVFQNPLSGFEKLTKAYLIAITEE